MTQVIVVRIVFFSIHVNVHSFGPTHDKQAAYVITTKYTFNNNALSLLMWHINEIPEPCLFINIKWHEK